MQTLEQAHKDAADLYKLAYLITGNCEAGLNVTMESIDSADEQTSFFSGWMVAWSRRVVISKALAGMRDDLTASARRTSSMRAKPATPKENWSLSAGTTAAEFERAVLAIDLFPRCALLLSIFERVSVEDAATLLDATPELVRKAQIIGLQELTANLASGQGRTSTPPERYVIMSGIQHA
ncbi:MAG: polymerase, sigma-24 subunit, subfamily [Candidatus Solibacter sp.]|nr:polymerase, sigma-24 subunit, subfamily [Candidatus Solibacter sp.]